MVEYEDRFEKKNGEVYEKYRKEFRYKASFIILDYLQDVMLKYT